MKLIERVPNTEVGGTAAYRFALVMTLKQAEAMQGNIRPILQWCNENFGLYGRDWSMFSATEQFTIYAHDIGAVMMFALRWVGSAPERSMEPA